MFTVYGDVRPVTAILGKRDAERNEKEKTQKQ